MRRQAGASQTAALPRGLGGFAISARGAPVLHRGEKTGAYLEEERRLWLLGNFAGLDQWFWVTICDECTRPLVAQDRRM